jgi:hypothetical protein
MLQAKSDHPDCTGIFSYAFALHTLKTVARLDSSTKNPTSKENQIMSAKMQSKSLSKPDELREFDKGKLELVKLGGVTFGRATLLPGWKWSSSLKALMKTKSCEAPHLQYHVSGRLAVLMDDGSQAEFGPGEVSLLPPGHDAWVVGSEAVVVIDISGMVEYARPHSH